MDYVYVPVPRGHGVSATMWHKVTMLCYVSSVLNAKPYFFFSLTRYLISKPNQSNQSMLFCAFSLCSMLLMSLLMSSGPIMQQLLSDWTTYCFSKQYFCVTTHHPIHIRLWDNAYVYNLVSDVIRICGGWGEYEIKRYNRKKERPDSCLSFTHFTHLVSKQERPLKVSLSLCLHQAVTV